MAGPHKQFDTNAALDRALAIFWRQGFELTSMQDLVDAMGINRASLYDTFGNKTELYKMALQRYKHEALAAIRRKLHSAPDTVQQRLLKFFSSLIASHEADNGNIGCFLNNTAVELGPHYPEIAALVREAWHDMEDIFKTLLDEGVAKGELPPGADTAALAATINMMLQGISVMAKAGTPDEHLLRIIHSALALLDRQS
jgi:TetR/AcrR family transcriptional repressor of nem operon